LRDNPTDTRRRIFLFELLCFAGEYDRAEKQLDVLAQSGPEAATGALLYRAALAAERTLEFNATAFDFMNHANWNDPDNVIGSVATPNLDAGKIIGSRGGRVIQLGLRLSF